jgi:Cu/Zn superoxide dismutase
MSKTKRAFIVLLVSLSAIFLCKNAFSESEEIKLQSESKEIKPALAAEIINDKGKIIGKAEFFALPQGAVLMKINVEKLKDGIQALHIHEKGECKTPDFMTAGGHYNPENKKHGFFNPEGYHKGDLPNIQVIKGKINLEILLPHFTIEELKGKSIMIHEHQDDYLSDPAGHAGKRIACGEIKEIK